MVCLSHLISYSIVWLVLFDFQISDVTIFNILRWFLFWQFQPGAAFGTALLAARNCCLVTATLKGFLPSGCCHWLAGVAALVFAGGTWWLLGPALSPAPNAGPPLQQWCLGCCKLVAGPVCLLLCFEMQTSKWKKCSSKFVLKLWKKTFLFPCVFHFVSFAISTFHPDSGFFFRPQTKQN